MRKKNRRNKCIKCKQWFTWMDNGWSTEPRDVSCPYCLAVYHVNIDESVEVWLTIKEKV